MNKLSLVSRVAIVLASLGFLHVTTHWSSLMAAIELVQATDAYYYLAIANVTPALPVDLLPYHFAQRWMPHYLVGLVATAPSLSIERAYLLVGLVLCLAIFWLSLVTILNEVKDRGVAILLFLFIVLSPFAYRLFIFVPALLADLVFVLGLAVVLRGLLLGRLSWVVVGMVLATSGKQMSLLLLPGVLLYTWSRFSVSSGRPRALANCLVVLVATVIAYAFLIKTSAHFSLQNSITSSILFALFPWLFSAHFSPSLLAEHFFRILIPTAPFFGVLVLAWRKVAINCSDRPNFTNQLFTLESVSLLLMVLGPMAYAFLPGPQVQMGNQSRYVALTLLPLALLVGRLLPEIRLQTDARDYLVFALLACGYSYHHRYTVVQANPSLFLVVHVAALIGVLVWFSYRATVKVK
jgi:hypothetical protein